MQFTKPPLTLQQQVQQLISRGLIVDDEELAASYLSHINYYRLGTYWWSFIDDHKTHKFRAETTFQQVLDLYVFDRELRLLVLDAIERIEIAVRTQWAYHVAHDSGAFAHLDPRLFNSKDFDHDGFMVAIRQELARTTEPNIKRQMAKYEETTPAIWICCELLSFGWLSKCVDGLARRSLKMNIADHFQLNETVLCSVLHHLTMVRNICAHHARLWNRDFTITMKVPRKGPAPLLLSLNLERPKELYNTLAMLCHFMNVIAPEHRFIQRLTYLTKIHPSANPLAMGFPEQWELLPLWKAI